MTHIFQTYADPHPPGHHPVVSVVAQLRANEPVNTRAELVLSLTPHVTGMLVL